MTRPPPRSTLFPYTTLFRSFPLAAEDAVRTRLAGGVAHNRDAPQLRAPARRGPVDEVLSPQSRSIAGDPAGSGNRAVDGLHHLGMLDGVERGELDDVVLAARHGTQPGAPADPGGGTVCGDAVPVAAVDPALGRVEHRHDLTGGDGAA